MNRNLKQETETLIKAAQEQTIRTNLIKAKVDITQLDIKSRMCRKGDERINHILSECSTLSQKAYKHRIT